VLAGAFPGAALGPGQAVRIMTGAPLPEGADAVEQVELVEGSASGETITLQRSVEAGRFVRHVGDDVHVGDLLVAPGDVLHPTRLGVLASQGTSTVLVHPRARVGVLSTGNELVRGPGPLGPAAIRDVNGPMLVALVEEAGAVAVDCGTVADDHAATRAAISDAVERCDVVITTGGVSVGDVDFVKLAIGELAGDTARSMQVAMRPGKPFAFGVVGARRVPVFGLPGNPVSTRVSFELFVRPALRQRMGWSTPDRPRAAAVLDCAMDRTPDGRAHLVHVVLGWGEDGRLHVLRAMREGSHLLHAVASANAVALVPDGDGLPLGAVVEVIVLHPDEVDRARRGEG
jgi:molybdenum cofactor synthesis domain-containing protein